MLRWMADDYSEIEWLVCGRKPVAKIDFDGWEERPEAYSWKLLVDHDFLEELVDGYEVAKSAAEAAFKAWLQSASLMHLPDGYQFAIQGLQDAIIFYDRVQSATQDERTAVGQDHWNRLEAAARKVAMLAAAKTGRDGRANVSRK